jgi:hypothetical protein
MVERDGDARSAERDRERDGQPHDGEQQTLNGADEAAAHVAMMPVRAG